MAEQNSTIDEDKSENASKHEELQKEQKANSVPDVEKFHPRELLKLHKLRKKIRIIDPASVYEYRHIKISIWSSIAQLLTLLVSVSILISFCVMNEFFAYSMVEGVGQVSNLTILDKLYNYLPLFLIFISCLSLRKKLKNADLPRYWLAMIANSFNRAVFNNIKLICFPLLVIFGSVITLSHYNLDFYSATVSLFNGVAYDIVVVILAVTSIIIYYRAFRFCFRRL